MIEPIKLPRLNAMVAIADRDGRPTPLFMRYFNEVLQRLEVAVGGIIDTFNAAQVAQEAADSAGTAAENAQQTADGKLSQPEADGLYVARDSTPDWDSPSGPVSRDSFATYAAPSVSDPPTQAEVQALAQAVAEASQRLGGLVTDLIAADVLTDDT